MQPAQIPPGQLVPHENNAPAQTVEYLGIIEPLVILPADEDGHRAIVEDCPRSSGHIRTASALNSSGNQR